MIINASIFHHLPDSVLLTCEKFLQLWPCISVLCSASWYTWTCRTACRARVNIIFCLKRVTGPRTLFIGVCGSAELLAELESLVEQLDQQETIRQKAVSRAEAAETQAEALKAQIAQASEAQAAEVSCTHLSSLQCKYQHLYCQMAHIPAQVLDVCDPSPVCQSKAPSISYADVGMCMSLCCLALVHGAEQAV